jgi:citrate synthase
MSTETSNTNDTIKRMDARKRDDIFTQKAKTKIWHEQPSADNPYVAQTCRIHGYDIEELSGSISYTDAIYLNIKGEIPTPDKKALLNAIFVALSNLGPRHPATRAVMSAAVSKTKISHLLPIGLSVLSGDVSGANEVEAAVKFIRKNINKPAASVAELSVKTKQDPNSPIITPGFGTHYGAIDLIAERFANKLSTYPAADRAIQWGIDYATALKPYGYGWRLTGVAAACFADIGFPPRASGGLFQLAAAPGLLAHGLEMCSQSVTAMPFVDDNDYHYSEVTHDKP